MAVGSSREAEGEARQRLLSSVPSKCINMYSSKRTNTHSSSADTHIQVKSRKCRNTHPSNPQQPDPGSAQACHMRLPRAGRARLCDRSAAIGLREPL
eukprot:6189806-Pleurochrysis_carterae.AAC.1